MHIIIKLLKSVMKKLEGRQRKNKTTCRGTKRSKSADYSQKHVNKKTLEQQFKILKKNCQLRILNAK